MGDVKAFFHYLEPLVEHQSGFSMLLRTTNHMWTLEWSYNNPYSHK